MTKPTMSQGEVSRLSAVAQRRIAYRRRLRFRATAIAVGSTLLVVIALVMALVNAPGWAEAQAAFANAQAAREVLPAVLEGLWLNLRVWAIASVAAVGLGLGLAALRTSRNPVMTPGRIAATVYVDVFRGVPLLLVLLTVGFGLPALRWAWLPVTGVFLGSMAIILSYTAYLAEIFRAGFESVHPAQVAAARSLGLTRGQAWRLVVLPQAVRNVTAPLASTLVALQKDSGLISVLGAVDAIRAAQIASSTSYNFTPYVVAGLAFMAVSIPLTRLVDVYHARGWSGAHRSQEIR